MENTWVGENKTNIITADFDKDNDLDLATTGGIGSDSYVSVLYNIEQITGISEDAENDSAIPTSFNLEQNYPNPFNPSTTIRFTITESAFVVLKIYDVLGNEVITLINELKTAGKYKINFDASDLTSGVYFYKLNAGGFAETKKMILLR